MPRPFLRCRGRLPNGLADDDAVWRIKAAKMRDAWPSAIGRRKCLLPWDQEFLPSWAPIVILLGIISYLMIDENTRAGGASMAPAAIWAAADASARGEGKSRREDERMNKIIERCFFSQAEDFWGPRSDVTPPAPRSAVGVRSAWVTASPDVFGSALALLPAGGFFIYLFFGSRA